MDLTLWLMNRASKLDKQTAWSVVTVILTDNAQIAEVKEQVFGRSEVTDVVALRYAPMPGIEDTTSAEVFVNVERAVSYTRTSWSTSKELALYIAHGCDHLAGQSDSTERGRLRMRRRELRWLREAEAVGLIDNLFL